MMMTRNPKHWSTKKYTNLMSLEDFAEVKIFNSINIIIFQICNKKEDLKDLYRLKPIWIFAIKCHTKSSKYPPLANLIKSWQIY